MPQSAARSPYIIWNIYICDISSGRSMRLYFNGQDEKSSTGFLTGFPNELKEHSAHWFFIPSFLNTVNIVPHKTIFMRTKTTLFNPNLPLLQSYRLKNGNIPLFYKNIFYAPPDQGRCIVTDLPKHRKPTIRASYKRGKPIFSLQHFKNSFFLNVSQIFWTRKVCFIIMHS